MLKSNQRDRLDGWMGWVRNLCNGDGDDDGDDNDILEHEIHVTLGALVGVTEQGESEGAMGDQPKDKDKDKDKDKEKNKDKDTTFLL